MDIAEIRRKAKELKAKEDEVVSAGKDAAKVSLEQASSPEETPISEELLAAAGEDFIIDDEGAAPVTGGEETSGEDELFELTRSKDDGADGDAIVEKLVDDPPPFNLEKSLDGKAGEELPHGEEATDIFVDEDIEIEDSVDSIILQDESSEGEPSSEVAVEVPSSVDADGESVVEMEAEAEDEDAICLEAITFMLDDEEYGIDIEDIKEVIKPRELTDVPKAPSNIMGILSLRGVVVPVMDLRRRLAMGHDKEGERIIIVKDGDEQLGLVVGRIVGAVSLKRQAIEPPPSFSSIDGELISAICRYDGEAFILLNIGRVIEKS